MVGFALAGAAFATGHHLYYASLNLTSSDGTTNIGGYNVSAQGLTHFVSTIFIFVVKLCLGKSMSTAFDQRLWYSVRRTALRLGGIDALFGVLSDPVAFLHFEMVRRAKVAAFLAFLTWTATFGVLPVPGSLAVQSIQRQDMEFKTVPTVNLAEQPKSGAIYLVGPIGEYQTPATILDSVASKSLLEWAITLWPSPCGADCAYNVTFFGPSFRCSAPTGTPDLLPAQIGAAMWHVAPVVAGTTTDTLTVQYMTDLKVQNNTWWETNCTSFNSTYRVAIQFHGNQQSVELLDVALGPSFGMNDGIITYQDPTFRPALAAVKDAVSNALIGTAGQSTQQGLTVSGGTLALYSALANNSIAGNPVFLPTTPQLIEQFLNNATISLMSRGLWSTTAATRITRKANVFVYTPLVLWAGYGAALALTLLAIAVGLHAVWHNGGGGGKEFSLIMATTRNPALDAIADRAFNEKEYYRDTYANLRFRYTHLGGRDSDRLAFCEE
ncbi:hypothetical protein C8R46DRAFT_1321067 [Mycena filopes]|nr:hypothetical protein C8R46DRAFT_1321067 [Mycena filopes]